MKTFINSKTSKAIHIALAAIISVTGSVGAWASVPTAPTVDWVDASVIQTGMSSRVEVDTGWFSSDVDNIYSVQYRIDDKPVKSHNIDQGLNYGDARFAVDADGEFELTIALCNGDGCSASDQVNVSIGEDGTTGVSFDTETVPIIDPTFDSVPVAAHNAASELDMVYQQYTSGLNQSEALWGTIASEVAKAALGSTVGYGVKLGFDAILGQFGMGQQDYAEQSGTTRVMADNALETGTLAVRNMYRYGIAPEVPVAGADTLGYAQPRGKTYGLTSYKAAELDKSTKSVKAGEQLLEAFDDIKREYKPAQHDNMSIEQFFRSLNIPVNYAGSLPGGWEGTGWQVNFLSLGDPLKGVPMSFELLPPVFEIKGNSLKVSYQPLCLANVADICRGKGSGPDRVRVWNGSQIKPIIEARKKEIDHSGGFKMQNRSFAHANIGLVDFTDRMNHAGFAANLDENDVQIAAFGDGSVSLPAGSLPGAEEGSECIGLPDEPTHLMQAGDFHLRWQPDGNLTLRDADNQLKFVSKTRHNADQLCWQDDGNLVIYNGKEVTYESDTSDDALGGYGGRELKLTTDGELKIINELDDTVWLKGVGH